MLDRFNSVMTVNEYYHEVLIYTYVNYKTQSDCVL